MLFVYFSRVSQVSIEDPVSNIIEYKLRNAHLQIVVICPVFLDRVTERPENALGISHQLSSDRVLTMMLGVQDIHLSTIHRSNLVDYQEWRKFYVKDQDETFVGQLLGAAVSILGHSNATALKTDKEAFSIHPKKVKLVILNWILYEDFCLILP